MIHDKFLIGERVFFDIDGSEELKGTGEILGISHKSIFYTHIILLDVPLNLDFEDNAAYKAIAVPGQCLKRI